MAKLTETVDPQGYYLVDTSTKKPVAGPYHGKPGKSRWNPSITYYDAPTPARLRTLLAKHQQAHPGKQLTWVRGSMLKEANLEGTTATRKAYANATPGQPSALQVARHAAPKPAVDGPSMKERDGDEELDNPNLSLWKRVKAILGGRHRG